MGGKTGLALPALAIAAAVTASPARAATVLGFERVNASYPSGAYAQVLAFYGGGTSSQATSGPNFGATFDSAAVAVCLNGLGGACSNASRGGTAPTSDEGALGIGAGASTALTFATAYTGFIAFRYQVAPGFVASIQAFDGPNGTGTALTGPLSLFNTAPGCPAYNALLCHLGPGGLGFVSGAKSVVFAGLPGKVVWDDLTFGAGNDPLPPPAVPEPGAWMLMLAGFGLIGEMIRRRRALRRA